MFPDVLRRLRNKAGWTQEELSKRLFVVKKFNSVGSDRIYLKSHLDGSNSENFLNFGISALKFLIEERDFKIDDLGSIHFID